MGLELCPTVGHRALRDVDPVDVVLVDGPGPGGGAAIRLVLVHLVAHDCQVAVGGGEDVCHLVHDSPLGDAHTPLPLLHTKEAISITS